MMKFEREGKEITNHHMMKLEREGKEITNHHMMKLERKCKEITKNIKNKTYIFKNLSHFYYATEATARQW